MEDQKEKLDFAMAAMQEAVTCLLDLSVTVKDEADFDMIEKICDELHDAQLEICRKLRHRITGKGVSRK